MVRENDRQVGCMPGMEFGRVAFEEYFQIGYQRGSATGGFVGTE